MRVNCCWFHEISKLKVIEVEIGPASTARLAIRSCHSNTIAVLWIRCVWEKRQRLLSRALAVERVGFKSLLFNSQMSMCLYLVSSRSDCVFHRLPAEACHHGDGAVVHRPTHVSHHRYAQKASAPIFLTETLSRS